MAIIRWQGNVSNAWAAAGNWIGGVIPAHGDDVQFLGADLGANRCGVGPTAVVLLNSIYADAAYDVAANATVCYANCGMTGRPISTVTIDGASRIADGVITTVTLNAGGQMRGGTADTIYLNHGNAMLRGGTVGTLYANPGVVDSGIAIVTITTAYMESGVSYVNEAAFAVTIGTLYLNGANTRLNDGTVTTCYMNGDTTEVRNGSIITTLYVYGAACEVSLTNIAAGNITNGPYMCSLDQQLIDYDTGEVISDLSQIPSYSAGRW